MVGLSRVTTFLANLLLFKTPYSTIASTALSGHYTVTVKVFLSISKTTTFEFTMKEVSVKTDLFRPLQGGKFGGIGHDVRNKTAESQLASHSAWSMHHTLCRLQSAQDQSSLDGYLYILFHAATCQWGCSSGMMFCHLASWRSFYPRSTHPQLVYQVF